MGPYVIGLMAGYFLYSNDCKLRINKVSMHSRSASNTVTCLHINQVRITVACT